MYGRIVLMFTKEDNIMTFNESNLDIVLKSIEESIHFSGDNISDPQNWNLKVDLAVQDIINKSPNEADKIRYTIKTLEMIGYIEFGHYDYSTIAHITSTGLKFLFLRLHNIKFI